MPKRSVCRAMFRSIPSRAHLPTHRSLCIFRSILSTLSPTLIESELFGHKRGSFTGAEADRVGWLEVCPSLGTVFLDEIGDLDPAIQVKLLRVLQSRTFSRLGDTEIRQFQGKIIAATNHDLSAQMRCRHVSRGFLLPAVLRHDHGPFPRPALGRQS